MSKETYNSVKRDLLFAGENRGVFPGAGRGITIGPWRSRVRARDHPKAVCIILL